MKPASPPSSCSAASMARARVRSVHLLNEWMDPRWLINRAFDEPSQDELERPRYWRYWLTVPPRGSMGLFLSAWYSAPLMDRVMRRTSRAEFDEALDQIVSFERTLADDGALILKFWMYLDKKAQRQRLRALERNPLTRWRVSAVQWEHWRMYDRFVSVTERLIQRTSTGTRRGSSWTVPTSGTAAWSSARGSAKRSPPGSRRAMAPFRLKAARRRVRRSGSGASTWCERPNAGGPRRSRAVAARQPRHVESVEQSRLPNRARAPAGTVERAAAEGGGRRPLGRARVRGLGCRGQRRRHPTRHGRARSARLSCHPRRRAE